MIFRRRAFLAGLGATLAAPAIVQASNLMKISVPLDPSIYRVYARSDVLVEIGGRLIGADTFPRVSQSYLKGTGWLGEHAATFQCRGLPKVRVYAPGGASYDLIRFDPVTQTEHIIARSEHFADLPTVAEARAETSEHTRTLTYELGEDRLPYVTPESAEIYGKMAPYIPASPGHPQVD